MRIPVEFEQFWAIVKGKVRRSQFGNTEDLKTRISEACDQVPRNHFRNFAFFLTLFE
ncbi:hypothetical protein EDC94DRAFT_565959 [Helicostylum pulchrum]|nr:hypothetical protein EDC94DRAFT_565959 [Helicostylum pulchrum]